MRLCVAMITFNRADLLTETVESLKRGGHDFGFVLIDNGSTDPAARSVAASYGAVALERAHTIGWAKNAAIVAAIETHKGERSSHDIVLCSDDDYAYRPGALATLMQFWEGLPGNIALVGTYMEPVYGWNPVYGVVDNVGGVVAQYLYTVPPRPELAIRGLLRKTVPGGGWSFRSSMWPIIGPFPDRTQGEDTYLLDRLAAQGYRFCALPLAEHTGKVSLAGNYPPKNAPAVDLARWGMA